MSLFISQSPVRANHTANGPVGYWKLDEGTGLAAADSSGHGNNGTLVRGTGTGSPEWVSPGHNGSGSALEFDGTGSVGAAANTVNLGNDASLNQLDNYTISIWVKFDPGYVGGGGTWANLFGRTTGTDWAYMIYVNSNGTIRPHHRNSNGTFVLTDSATVMPTGEWVHIEQVADGSNLRLYINGVEDSNFPISYSGTTYSLPTANTYIGQDTRESAPLATISEVKVFNQAINAPGGVRDGLATWQKADDGTAAGNITTWGDSSGNGNEATTNGTLTLQNNTMNFNPSVLMDNGTARYTDHLGITGTNGFSTFFAAQLRSGHQNMLWGTWNGAGQAQHYANFSADGRVATGVGHQAGVCNATTSGGVPLGQPRAISLIRSESNTIAGKQNGGLSSGSQTCTASFGTGARLLGGRLNGSGLTDRMRGNIAEAISYDRTVTAAEENRINSYLGIKYGLTLDQTTPQNYTASNGTTISWNATTNLAYRYNITGIGRDDSSDLNQKQSRSINPGGIVTMANGTLAADNPSNSNNLAADNSFLVFGDNNSSATTWASTGVTNTPLANYQRLPRTWKVQETGTVGNVTIALDTADPDADVPTAITGYYLLRDSDNDSSFADETPILMTDSGGGQFSVGGVNFSNGELFTFATLSNTYTVQTQVVDNLTGEDGDTGTFKVRLGARPSAAVTVALTSSNTNEGTVPASITIQPGDWDNFDANVVTVTGVNDTPAAGDGAVQYTIVTGDVTSADANFNVLAGSDVADVTMHNQNDDPPGVKVTVVDNTTSENGSTATVRFELLSAPSGNVVIPLSLSDSSEGALGAVTSITITPANWNQPQNNEVVVTGVDDALTDGDILYQLLTGDPTSGDTGYNALTGADVADVALVNTDNDAPGVTVTQTGGFTNVTEGGATDTFTVVLDTQPAPGNVVVINLQPDGQLNLGAGAATATQLTFNNANWNVPQAVTVTANNDSVIENAHSGAIDISIHGNTTESSYLTVNPSDVTAQITDNDIDDGDGIPSDEEDAAPSNGDANDDGTPDSQQPHVASFVNEVTGEYVALEVDSTCQIDAVSMAAETSNNIKDPGFDYPVGMMNFTADCGTPGYTAAVAQYYYDAANVNFVLRKHNPNTSAYFTITDAVLVQVTIGSKAATRATYQITEGGTLDIDGSANGVIVDPAGLAQTAVGAPNTGLGRILQSAP